MLYPINKIYIKTPVFLSLSLSLPPPPPPRPGFVFKSLSVCPFVWFSYFSVEFVSSALVLHLPPTHYFPRSLAARSHFTLLPCTLHPSFCFFDRSLPCPPPLCMVLFGSIYSQFRRSIVFRLNATLTLPKCLAFFWSVDRSTAAFVLFIRMFFHMPPSQHIS